MKLNDWQSASIAVSLNYAFYNKDNLTERKSAFTQFTSQAITPQELAAHILSGKAWAPACFLAGRRDQTAFQTAQILALDLDKGPSVEMTLNDPFIRQYAFLVHPSAKSTPASPKTRVVFILEEAVHVASVWQTMQRGLINHFSHLEPDTACKDAARMFYGSDVPGEYINPDARLPMEVAGALTQPEAAREMERLSAARTVPVFKPQSKQNHRRGLSETLVKEVEQQLGVLGLDINSSGFVIEPIPCPIKNHEHDDTDPATYWHPDKKFAYCYKCAQVHLTKTIASALGIHFYQPPVQEIIKCRHKFMSEYDLKSLIEERNTLLLKSSTGSGKTEAIPGMIVEKAAARVLILAHRRTLTRHITERCNTSLAKLGHEHQFKNYDGLTHEEIHQTTHLVLCINSLPKLVKPGQPIPHFDFVIMDEISQQLMHLIGNTFEGDEAVTTYGILRDVIQQATYVIGMDAYADTVCLRWLQALRGKDNVTALVNKYRRYKGRMTLWGDFAQVIQHANHILETKSGCIVFPVNTIKWAKILYSYYSGDMIVDEDTLSEIDSYDNKTPLNWLLNGHFYNETGLGRDAVMVIHGDNSSTLETQNFLNNINGELPHRRILIYTSAMGTGVDIQAPVEAVLGLFNPGILTADELHQMMGRCRNVKEYHVCIIPQRGGRETSPQELYRREMKNAEETGRLLGKRASVSWEKDSQGLYQLHKKQQAFLRLWSSLQARANKSLNRLKTHFLELAQGEYEITDWSNVTSEDIDDPAVEQVEEDIAVLHQAHKEIDKYMVLASEPLNKNVFESLLEKGQHTQLHIAGYIRWGIETSYRQTITPDIYNHSIDNGAAKLRNFIDVFYSPGRALQRDRNQDIGGYATPFRSNSVRKRDLIHEAMIHVWGPFESLDELTPISPKAIDERISHFMEHNRTALWDAFRWRKGHTDKPKNVLKRLLREIGLNWECLRSGVHKGNYQITQESLLTMQRYADAYLAADRGDLAHGSDIIAA